MTKRYGIWGQPRDGSQNGWWVITARYTKEYAEFLVGLLTDLKGNTYQVREIPKRTL